MSGIQRQDPAPGGATPRPHGHEPVTRQTAWVGWVAFGASMMVLLGTFHVFAAVVALFRETYFVAPESQLVVSVSYDTWGWVHLIGGLLVVAAGVGLFTGAMWARVLGVGVATLSAIVNLAFLAAYPIWSVLMITLAILVIYAITAHGEEIRNAE